MKVLLVNVDSVIPNLALQKIRVYHEKKGDTIIQMKDQKVSVLPFINEFDKIYVSCVFDYNKHFCKKWEGIAEIGGSGYSLIKKLPDVIEKVKPKMNFGFTTRGCIRNCYFCIVREKEGKIKVVADIYDLWDNVSKEVLLLDNNILALPKHFLKICKQLKKEKLKVDFNQGLDHRLLTDFICQELLSLSYSGAGKIRFAFDDISYEKSVIKAIKMLQKNGMKKWRTRWYIYVGVQDTKENVLKRVNILRDAKQLVFVMRDRKIANNLEFREIYSWSCHVTAYATVSFSEYTKNPNRFPKIADNMKSLFD